LVNKDILLIYTIARLSNIPKTALVVGLGAVHILYSAKIVILDHPPNLCNNI